MPSLFVIYIILSTCVVVSGQSLVAYSDGTVWGYKSGDSIVIPPRYMWARDFEYGYGVVSDGEFSGMVDSNDRLIIPFIYHAISPLNDSLFVVGNRALYFGDFDVGVINKDLKWILPMKFRYIYLHQGLLYVMTTNDSVMSTDDVGDMFTRERFFGLYNLHGNEIIPVRYRYLQPENDSLLIASIGDKYGLMKSDGTQLTAIKFMVIGQFRDGISTIRREPHEYGILNSRGVEKILPYQTINSFSEGLAVVRTDSTLGFIDTSGFLLFEARLDILRAMHRGAAAANLNGKWGMIDRNGKTLIDFNHDDYLRSYQGIILFKKENLWAVFDSIGRQVTEYTFDYVGVFDNKEDASSAFWRLQKESYQHGIAIVGKDGKYGIVDKFGHFIEPMAFTHNDVYVIAENYRVIKRRK